MLAGVGLFTDRPGGVTTSLQTYPRDQEEGAIVKTKFLNERK